MKNLTLLLSISVLFLLSSCNQGNSTTEQVIDENTTSTEITTDEPANNDVAATNDNATEQASEKSLNTQGNEHSTEGKELTAAEKEKFPEVEANAKELNTGDFLINSSNYIVNTNDYSSYTIVRFTVRLITNKRKLISETIVGSKLPELASEKISNAESGSYLVFSSIRAELDGDTINVPASFYKLK
ncbi:MAG: hypothetical protein KAG84_03925 [Bacteroidales bacterium]|nr:hypothetical protein [Bacteroidales bacterium]